MRRLLIFAAVFGLQTAHAHPSERESLSQLAAQLSAQPGQLHLQLDRAEHLLSLRKADDALAAVRSSGLHTVRAHRLAARAYLLLSDGESARTHLDQALRLSPTDVAALWLRADLCEKGQDLACARADLATMVRTNTKSTPGAYLRLARMQDPRDATAVLRLGLTRTHALVLRRALVQTSLAAQDYALALKEAALWVSASPNATEALLSRAEAHAGLGQAVEAQNDREAALAQAERAVHHRKSAAALARRAQVRQALGDGPGSIVDAKAALRRAPGLKLALTVLAGGAK